MRNIKKFFKMIKKSYIWLFIFSFALVSALSIIKYKNYEVNYYNADATWHALLTIEAYDKTPISKHLFLPIVTLGNGVDKNISWGLTIPDKYGNFYYTSFSPAGYFLPWLFFKIFKLPVAEKSLYIFNSLLFIISAMLWVKIITFIYRKSKYVIFLALVSLLVYVCAPEILHGMGYVYWHQSIFQVTFLIQLYSYLLISYNESKAAKYVFYAVTLLNPYIEWTGYVANAGFFIVEFIKYCKQSINKAIKKSFPIILLTIISGILFCGHYLIVVNPKSFFMTVIDRFMARNITNNVSIGSLIMGYLTSFKYLYILLIALIFGNFAINKKLSLENRIIIFLCLFPILENFIMKEHAIIYSYDRMKLIFPISLIICELIQNIMDSSKKKRITLSIIFIITILCGVCNIRSYNNDTTYVWRTDYKENNKKLVDYINKNYKSYLLATGVVVRGYMSLLFEKGIYEFETYEALDELKIIAKNNNQDYVIFIETDGGLWNTYKISGATVFNVKTNEVQKISLQQEKIVLES